MRPATMKKRLWYSQGKLSVITDDEFMLVKFIYLLSMKRSNTAKAAKQTP